MCSRNQQRSQQVSPVAARITKLTILLVFLCFTEIAAGGNFRGQPTINKKKISSCLSYGHSCWGAHGKRDGNAIPKDNSQEEIAMEDVPLVDIPTDTRWFLSRFYQGLPSYRMLNARENLSRQQNGSDRDNASLDEVLRSISDDEIPSSIDEQNYFKNWKENQLIKLFQKNHRFGLMNRKN